MQSKNERHIFIHANIYCKTLTFSSVVLVGFNLELHSTLNINEKLLLSSKKGNNSSCFFAVTNSSPRLLSY